MKQDKIVLLNNRAFEEKLKEIKESSKQGESHIHLRAKNGDIEGYD